MTGRIIQMPSDDHRDVQLLLPWYLTGELDESERSTLQAHLDQCADCRAELAAERRLSRKIAETPADAEASDVEHGWRMISQSLGTQSRDRSSSAGRTAGLALRLKAAASSRSSASWLGWAVAAQFCLLVVMGVTLWRNEQPTRYHTLGATPAGAPANLVVIFKPDTPERDLRAILQSSGARLVGGPTESDAYLLHVATEARSAALARLREETEVVVAEPVDGG
jgi:hypothetical protein